ncbi:calpain-5-like isoform X1 [Mytilus trossulus]|uniref:calpain-5-like isoform X1 n=2 Tax=Mytilus trossulus TaxID=6551 RepID=UPI0030055060
MADTAKEVVRSIMSDKFKNQKFGSIKSACLKKGELWEDPEFPANNKSLFFSKVDSEIEWKRPSELCKVPKLVIEGVSCDDLVQGELGNTWFVTACASLVLQKKMFEKVVPNLKEQEWDEYSEKPKYAGVFHFSFWRFGQWIDIVVDDRLPTKNGKLVFCHSKSRNEFWSALLEKAYAKLYGDYESLTEGDTADALVDFTGGVAEKLVLMNINLQDDQMKMALFRKLRDASENQALINCNIRCKPEETGKELPQGLILGHGYNITKVAEINVDKKYQGAIGASKLLMVRMANPWGVKEWNGPWADGSAEWNKIGQTEWTKLGLKFQQEGEFWMAFDDFVSYLTNVDVCHFVNTAIISLKKSWNESILHSEWSVQGRNGGCVYDSPTFLSNPQYVFDIIQEEDTVLVSLEQHDIQPGRQHFGRTLNTIGYRIMKVEENRLYRMHIPGEHILSSDMVKGRSIFGTSKLFKGRYVIVPCTEKTGEHGPFMLRLYTSSKASGRELTKEGPTKTCPCSKLPLIVTTLTVNKLEGVTKPAGSKVKTFDPKVVVRCEGEKVVSRVVKEDQGGKRVNTADAEFDFKVTFYRKKPDEPIIIEIINSNSFVDDFCSEARVAEHGGEDGKDVKCPVYGKGKEKDMERPGNVHVFVKSSHDLQFL